MSRGLGRVEIAIASAFIRNPTRAFTVADLIAVAFPKAKEIEKKHKVSTVRAADLVAAGVGWVGFRTPEHPPRVVFANLLSVRSYEDCRAKFEMPVRSEEDSVERLVNARAVRQGFVDRHGGGN